MSSARHFLQCVTVVLLCQVSESARTQSVNIQRLPSVEPARFSIAQSQFSFTSNQHESGFDFPPLPPDPYEQELDPLPPLEEELYHHGGSYLYAPEGDRLNWPEDHGDSHYDLLRLPEDYPKPQPVTMFAEFLGADPVYQYPQLKWFGEDGYAWEPRVVIYGSYEMFGILYEEGTARQDGIGHQLLLDFDLQLTGTERFHVQYRPIGERNTGGSFLQLSDPDGYIDNSTAEPDRYWFEGEFHSIFSNFLDPSSVWDYNFATGRFPLSMHNSLLINDDVLGVVLSKNTIYLGNLSNFNLQGFYGIRDVNTFVNSDAELYGMHASIDYRHVFYEATCAHVKHESDSSRDQTFAALSRTKLYGPLTIALRSLLKWGDEGGLGDGQLFVLESNRTRYFESNCLGLEYGVFYCNALLATEGWNSIGGGNINRLRSAFEVNPLVTISTGQPVDDTWGVSLGAQLFRCHEDESFLPEFSFQAPGGESVWAFGLRYLRKTGARSYFEALGIINYSDSPQFDREGIFISETIVF